MLLLGGFACENVDLRPSGEGAACEVVDMHYAQLVCNNRHNIDIEPSASVVVPAVRTTASNISRQAQLRATYLITVEHLRSLTNYPISHFIHRLGSSNRAVDFYLYTLCQLRL